MANYSVSDTKLITIADAIREANGSTNTYTLDAMPNAILTIPTYKKIYSGTYTVESSTTSWKTVSPAIALGTQAWTKNNLLYIKVRATDGLQPRSYLGGDTWYANYRAYNDQTSSVSSGSHITYYSNNTSAITEYITASSYNYGLVPYTLTSAGDLTMRYRYSSTYTPNLDGTYSIEIFLLPWPIGGDPWFLN